MSKAGSVTLCVLHILLYSVILCFKVSRFTALKKKVELLLRLMLLHSRMTCPDPSRESARNNQCRPLQGELERDFEAQARAAGYPIPPQSCKVVFEHMQVGFHSPLRSPRGWALCPCRAEDARWQPPACHEFTVHNVLHCSKAGPGPLSISTLTGGCPYLPKGPVKPCIQAWHPSITSPGL